MLGRYLIAMAGVVLAGSVFGQITTNYTLTADQTFTSQTGVTYQIGHQAQYRFFNVNGYTATLTGSGSFQVYSEVKGTGAMEINLSDPTQIVTYRGENTFTGETRVLSGILLLDTPEESNNGILGDLIIGGGPNQAIVRRPDTHNRELIDDTITITLRANGVLELNRAEEGGSQQHSSLETFGELILDGGTLLNASGNTNATTINIGSLTLLQDSVIDLGAATALSITNIDSGSWNPDATLVFSNWTAEQTITVDNITGGQLDQIAFATETGLVTAAFTGGEIVPQSTVPEATTLAAIPLLGGFVAVWELRRRRRKS